MTGDDVPDVREVAAHPFGFSRAVADLERVIADRIAHGIAHEQADAIPDLGPYLQPESRADCERCPR